MQKEKYKYKIYRMVKNLKLKLDPDCIDFGSSSSLGTTTPKSRIGIEFTMTHPHNVGWLNARSKRQQQFYNDAYLLLLADLRNNEWDIKESAIYYEYHSNGQVHAHGYFVVETNKTFNTAGLLSDLSKVYLRLMPKRNSNFKESYIKHNPTRLFSPMLNLNVYEKDVRPEWRTYIKKCQ